MKRKSAYQNLRESLERAFVDRLITYHNYLFGLRDIEEFGYKVKEEYLEKLKKSSKESEVSQGDAQKTIEWHRGRKKCLDIVIGSLHDFFPELRLKEERNKH